jgi:hypothetical protein
MGTSDDAALSGARGRPAMTGTSPPVDRFSLRRWSQRKLAASRGLSAPEPASGSPSPAVAGGPASAPATTAPQGAGAAAPAAVELPAIDSLSLASDFTPFLKPEVDESLRRQALKKLFGQPAFNVMDGLDVYIDDYGKPDPIAPEMVRQLVQARYLFDPPKTRVNAQGAVEDVPPEDADDAPHVEHADPADSAAEASLAEGLEAARAPRAAPEVPEPRVPVPPPSGEPTS